MMKEPNDNSRRQFLKQLGIGTASAVGLMVLEPLRAFADSPAPKRPVAQEPNQMTYRVNHHSGDKVSLLGFGMMRLPKSQDEVNRMVDYALAHGVNYFDTAPAYGPSEDVTGNALSRHPRE